MYMCISVNRCVGACIYEQIGIGGCAHTRFGVRLRVKLNDEESTEKLCDR